MKKYVYQISCDFYLKKRNENGYISVISGFVQKEDEPNESFFGQRLPKEIEAHLVKSIGKKSSDETLKTGDVDLKYNINKLN
ncbi:MAG: hypothetical protein U0469_00990 [Candidatus Paceibacterota bacterium]